MIISITNALFETKVVFWALLTLVIISIVKKKDGFFSQQTTTELKGVALLMVVLSHIGYFLVDDHRFLVPLSNYAGVGVDLFLVLSGYGLVVSALRKPLPILAFYRRRFSKIFLPTMLTVLLLIGLDFFILHRTYPGDIAIKNILGFIPHADLYQDINSPLWFVTILLIYYLIFPLLFNKRFPLASAAVMAMLGWALLNWQVPERFGITSDLAKLYKLHFLAFPWGMALGALLNQPGIILSKLLGPAKPLFTSQTAICALRWCVIGVAVATLVYTKSHSDVGEGWKREGLTSLVSATAFIAMFAAKKIQFRFLTLLGTYSFEMYLLHWPLVYRYNIFYGRMPAGVATLLYLLLLLGLGYLYHLILELLFKRLGTSPTKASLKAR